MSIYSFSKENEISFNYFFSIIFFSNEIPIVENENFICTCLINNIYLINGKTEYIFTFWLLLVYYIRNFTPINFFKIKPSILVEKRFLHNLRNIKFISANEISIRKKLFEKKYSKLILFSFEKLYMFIWVYFS